MSEGRPSRWLGGPVTGAVCRVALGGLFIYAAWPKMAQPEEAARLISAYRIVHPDLVNLAAIVLPWVEVVPAVLLVVGLWVRSAAVVLAGLLAAFIGAAALVMMRGMEISCGCFLPFLGDRVSWTLIARDLVLMVLAAQIIIWPSSFLSRQRGGRSAKENAGGEG